jgi:serine protease Do
MILERHGATVLRQRAGVQRAGPIPVRRSQELDQRDSPSGQRPQLGIAVIGMTPELRALHGVSTDRGVLFGHVEPGSLAARAGLRVGDILIAVRATPVSDVQDVR